jgi:HAE1 family hydrophobic/amphiphilic exporter-1
VRLPGRLEEVSEFENMVIQVGDGGNLVRLKDVGRAELGSESYSFDVKSEENLAAGLLVYQLPGSNALDVATAVRERMLNWKAVFPPGFGPKLCLTPRNL